MSDAQRPDAQPGAYYVTCFDGPARCAILVGPFVDDHAGALAMVDAAREAAERADPRAHWYSFGTGRFPSEFDKPGRLNEAVGFKPA